MTTPPTPPTTLAERLAAVPIYLIATCPPDGGPVLQRVAQAARALHQRAGRVAVQLRCKQAGTPARRELLARLRGALPPDALLLVNDDLQAVHDARGSALADGVHLGREDAEALAPAGTPAGVPAGERRAAGLRAARAQLGASPLLGTSTRTRAELVAALQAGADHAGFGAIAPSGTKSDTQPADLQALRELLAEFPRVPLFPIGGVTPEVLGRLATLGARRAAVGAAILQAPDPAAAALDCLAALRAR